MIYTNLSFNLFLTLSNSDYFWIVVLGSVLTVYPMITSADLMNYLSPYTMMLSINLEPVYGIFLAYIIFKDSEIMNLPFYLGALVILFLIVLNTLIAFRKKNN